MKYDYYRIREGEIILISGQNKSTIIVIIKGINDDVFEELGRKMYLTGDAFNDYRMGLSVPEIIEKRKQKG